MINLPFIEYVYTGQNSTGSYVVYRVLGTLAMPSYETIQSGLSMQAAYELATRLNVEGANERSRRLGEMLR